MSVASITIVRGLSARRCSACTSDGQGAFALVKGLGSHLLFCRVCAERIGVAAKFLNTDQKERVDDDHHHCPA